MARSSILIDIDDPRAAKIAEVMSNKTSKKILSSLAEKELSESEISLKLGLPMNTVNYNVRKLVETGLIEKKRFLWSKRGKKVNYYTISDKRIIISPKKVIRGILPAALISGVIALIIRHFSFLNYRNYQSTVDSASAVYAGDAAFAESGKMMAETTTSSGGTELYNFLINAPNSWAWFLIGALAGLLIFLLWNYARNERKFN